MSNCQSIWQEQRNLHSPARDSDVLPHLDPIYCDLEATLIRYERFIICYTLNELEVARNREFIPHPAAFFSFPGKTQAKTGSACSGESVNLSCREDELLLVQSARYGVLPGRCGATLSQSAVTCFRPVWHVVHARCTGRTKCHFRVTKQLFGDPCPTQSLTFEVAFSCVNSKQSHPDCSDRRFVFPSKWHAVFRFFMGFDYLALNPPISTALNLRFHGEKGNKGKRLFLEITQANVEK